MMEAAIVILLAILLALLALVYAVRALAKEMRAAREGASSALRDVQHEVIRRGA